MSLSEVMQGQAQALIKLPTINVGVIATDTTKLLPNFAQTSKQSAALGAAINKNQQELLLNNPVVLKNIQGLQSTALSSAISQATGSKPSKKTKEAINAYTTNQTNAMAQNAITTNQEIIQPLKKGTVEGIIAKEQLADTTTAYVDLMAKYNDLLKTGSGDIDIKQLLIYGGIAAAGLIVLSMFLKK